MIWCLNNHVKIWFEPLNFREGRIVIENEEDTSVSEEVYVQHKFKVKDVRYWNVVYDLYYKIYKEKTNEN